ncbi:MAG: hypothetical protein M3R53_08105 [Candidatus Eremiobacteraeota bacterium]|nr:hypothetical protein [Candidatus Eremiobacteraeota bacterium]
MTVVAQTIDQSYSVDGKDSFSIAGDIRSEISYSGTQTLRIRRHGKRSRYAAHVEYRRSDGPASTDATSDYVAEMLPSGEIVESSEHDPDYLTVLNQPFAAQLDRQTLGDLRHMGGTMPFDFPSPFTGSSLHGYLRHIGGGTLGPRHATGVRFEAAGPMKGALPDRPGVTLAGTITMRGTAFYDSTSAVLLALDSTVTINGTLSNRAGNDPVTITYERKIRAHEPQPTESARRAP